VLFVKMKFHHFQLLTYVYATKKHSTDGLHALLGPCSGLDCAHPYSIVHCLPYLGFCTWP
jgi:hypothetical protein